MSRSFLVPEDLYEYVLRVSLRENAVQRELREETSRMEQARMQTGPDQLQFLQVLAKTAGARRCIEVGVFTGASALAVALVLPDDGRIVACDLNEEYTAVARRYWERAGVASKIDLRLAPAVESLDALLSRGEAPYDFAYIDADKSNYDAYYERILRLLRPGGLICVDNVLWGGDVANPEENDPDTAALRALNEKIGRDQRVDASLLTIGDGLTVARKR